MRERFWINESRRYEALRKLKSAEGVEEAIVLSTRCRTEFLLWADDATLAANSLVSYLSAEHGLKLSEWEHFYRRLGDAALAHIFRLACCLDCQALCASDAVTNLNAAWEQARTVGASSRCLNDVLAAAFRVSERVRKETGLEKAGTSIPAVVLEVTRRIFGSLQGRKILLLGAGTISEFSASLMAEEGAQSVVVIDQSPARAQEVAHRLAGSAATQADRWRCLLEADIVISASGCQHVVLTREEAERIAAERNRVALLIVDLGVPRDVDPEARRVDGILLYDVDGLERTVNINAAERAAICARAEKIIAAEVQAFRSESQPVAEAPTAAVLRRHLDQVCRQELDSFIQERGPLTREQDHLLHTAIARLAQGIASSLAREIKQVPGREERDRVAAAVACLFHLNSPAGTTLEKKNESKHRITAVNY